MFTADKIEEAIFSEIKASIESNVELICYLRNRSISMLYCEIHYKNGFVFVGKSILLSGGNVDAAKDKARRDALKYAIIAERYSVCDRIYKEASYG